MRALVSRVRAATPSRKRVAYLLGKYGTLGVLMVFTAGLVVLAGIGVWTVAVRLMTLTVH